MSTARLTAGAPRFTARGDLVERRRLGGGDRGEQIALLPGGLGRDRVAAQLLDQPREAPRERRCR